MATYRGEDPLRFYVVQDDLTPDDKSIIRKAAMQCDVHFLTIDASRVAGFPTVETKPERQDLTLSTYYRLFLPELLPEDITKLLYLDVDVIVLDSIHKLWKIDLSGYALAGVEDYNGKPLAIRQNLAESDLYINAGMLLMNLEYLRNMDFQTTALSYIKEHKTSLRNHDQDVLNVILSQKKLILPCRWNMSKQFLQKEHKKDFHSFFSYSAADLYEGIMHPGIIHFMEAGASKPWYKECKVPFHENYEKYADELGLTLPPQHGMLEKCRFELNRLLVGPPYIKDTLLKNVIWAIKKLIWNIKGKNNYIQII